MLRLFFEIGSTSEKPESNYSTTSKPVSIDSTSVNDSTDENNSTFAKPESNYSTIANPVSIDSTSVNDSTNKNNSTVAKLESINSTSKTESRPIESVLMVESFLLVVDMPYLVQCYKLWMGHNVDISDSQININND